MSILLVSGSGEVHIAKLVSPERAVHRGAQKLNFILFLSDACINLHLHAELLATPSVQENWSSMSQHPGKHYTEPNVTINGETLQADGKFVYLGSIMSVSEDISIDGKIVLKFSKACAAFDNLREKVCERKGFSIQIKLKVYKCLVLSSLLYACETWPVYSHHADTK